MYGKSEQRSKRKRMRRVREKRERGCERDGKNFE